MYQVLESTLTIHKIALTNQEIDAIRMLTRQIATRHLSVEEPTFLSKASIYAQNLPGSLRTQLNDFRLFEPSGLCLVTGYPINNWWIGATPEHWKNKQLPSPSLEADIFFFLCASLLGDPIGWSTQQDGYILHDILPIKGHEQEQLGSGSETLLTWHTEDAFHPYRADYLSLMCLRNHDNVATTYASIDDVHLDETTWRTLFEPRFVIRPDESHLEKNRSDLRPELGASEELLRRSYARIEQMNKRPERIPVLFGDPARPYARLDPYFMDRLHDDPEAMLALDKLIAAIDEQITTLALQPGEILFLDNFKVVHGRVPFVARYDGTDRWLRRLNVTRDIRKSRDARTSAASRIIF